MQMFMTVELLLTVNQSTAPTGDTQMSCANKSSAVAAMGNHDHNRHGPKRGRASCAPFAGELGPRLTQCGLGRGLLRYQVASSSIQPFGHNRHGPKTGGRAVPLLGGAVCDPI